jgi:hypothetical protein
MKERKASKQIFSKIHLLRFLNSFSKGNKGVRMDQGSTLRNPRLVVRSNNKGWQGHNEQLHGVVYG